MIRYIVTQIIDRWPVGADVTERYTTETALRLVGEGFLEAVDDEESTPEPEPTPAPEVALDEPEAPAGEGGE